MGVMEKEAKSRLRRMQVEQAVLATIAVAGILSVAALAPGAARLFKHIDPHWLSKRDPRRRLRETVSKLKRKGLIEFQEQKGKKVLLLTKKGQQVADSVWREDFRLKKPRRWDGRWRLVIFDIRENKRGMRDKIRILLSRIGFLRLQNSVWVYPYDCEEVITLLKTDLKVGRAVLYVIADAIEFDKPIRQHFKLPLE